MRMILTHNCDHLYVPAFEGPLEGIAICLLNVPSRCVRVVRQFILSVIAFFGLLLRASHNDTLCFTVMYNCEMENNGKRQCN